MCYSSAPIYNTLLLKKYNWSAKNVVGQGKLKKILSKKWFYDTIDILQGVLKTKLDILLFLDINKAPFL